MKKEKMMLFILIAILMFGVISIFAIITAEAKESEGTYLSEDIQEVCNKVATDYDLSPELLMAICERESAGDVYASGDGGKAYGLMQIHACYQQERMQDLGITNLYDPESNIRVGAEIICEWKEQYPDMRLALAKYNGVSNAVEKYNRGEICEYSTWVLNRATEIRIANIKERFRKVFKSIELAITGKEKSGEDK